MWPDWVSNPGLLTYESGVLPTALRGPEKEREGKTQFSIQNSTFGIKKYPKRQILI